MGASKCAACSRPAAEGRKTCETCLANSRRRAAERRRRLGTEAIREAKRVDYQRHRESYLARALDLWGDKCLACGASEVTMDHVVPLANGGTNAVENLQPLCIDCNRAKNRKTIDYRARVA